MKNRLLSLTLVLLMCLALFPMSVAATSNSYSGDGYTLVRTPIPGSTDYSYEAFDDGWGLYSGTNLLRKDGKLIELKLYGTYVPSINYSSVVDGRYKMIIVQNGERRHGFFDENGNVAVDFIYESSYAFSDGLAAVQLNGKWGYIDTSGNVVIPFEYDWAQAAFYDGLSCVEKDGRYGFVDRTGTVIIPVIYESPSYFSEGLAPVMHNGAMGYIDKTGATVIPFQYDKWYGALNFSEGIAQVQKNGVTSFIDKTGKIVFSVSSNASYQLIGNGIGFADGRCVVIDNMSPVDSPKYGFIDNQGNLAIPMIYESNAAFSCGFAAVKKDGKYGYIDVLGNEVVPFVYERAINFTDDLALVKDKQGQWYTLEIVPSGETTPTLNTPSSWATEQVNAAIAEGLVPEILQKNYTQSVPRGNMAQMLINLIENSSGQTIDEFLTAKGASANSGTFTDTTDKAILAANALGILSGVGDDKFDPDGTLTRGQIAAIISRTARVLGVNTGGYTHNFTDVSGHWASAELGWPVYAGVITGVGDNKFDPDGKLTAEQAIAITYRSLKFLMDKTYEPAPTSETTPAPEQNSDGKWPNLSGSEVWWDNSVYTAILDYAATKDGVTTHMETSSTEVKIYLGAKWPVMRYEMLVFSNDGIYSTSYRWDQETQRYNSRPSVKIGLADASSNADMLWFVNSAQGQYDDNKNDPYFTSTPTSVKFPWE